MKNIFSYHRPAQISKQIFIALSLALWFSSCENSKQQIEKMTEKVLLEEKAIDVVSYLSQDGKMKAKLSAPVMNRVASDTQFVEFPQTLHVDFFNDSAAIETRLDSRYGKYYENLNKVYLRDSVVVITTKGDTLRSPDLWWDQNTKMFYTDKYAVYHGAGKNIFGHKGLTATQDLSSVIFNDVSGTIQGHQGDY
jgi:LPS export ABC transporter protein LptC